MNRVCRAALAVLAWCWAVSASGSIGAERPPEFGWLGITIAEVGEDLADRLATTFGPDAGNGVQIVEVLKGGPADQARLERGDVIVQFDAQPIWEVRQLQRLVRAQSVNRRVVLTVLRGSSRVTVPVSVGAMPVQARALLAGERFGFLARDVGDKEGPPGQAAGRVVVAFVDPESAASRGGLRPLDVILRVNDRPIRTLEDFERALWDARGSVSLLVERRDAAAPIELTLPPVP